MTKESALIIHKTQRWLDAFVVGLNLCPFARREIRRDSLRIEVSYPATLEDALNDCFAEVLRLDNHKEIETTLLIFPTLFQDFFDYLNFISLCESALIQKNYEGIYQIASFHPDYCFAGEDGDDVSNYTNRSPYPMIHLLREESLEKAIQSYGNTDEIPQTNMNKLRKLGLEEIKKMLLQNDLC